MIVGQMDISISPVVKIIFFDLFLFATGYKVGPQFFYGLKKDAIPTIAANHNHLHFMPDDSSTSFPNYWAMMLVPLRACWPELFLNQL